MKAVVLRAFGPPEALVAEEVLEPVAGPGGALVDVEVASVTFVETQVRAGRPPNPSMLPDLPVVLGNGVAGTVRSVDSPAARSWVGARVITTTGGRGGYAERAVAPGWGLIRVPDELTLIEAAALVADGRTAVALVQTAGLTAGSWALVEAAAGGVGTLLVQLARLAGARVVATAGGARKLALVKRLGADIAVDHRAPDWPDVVRGEVGAVDVVFDGVGGMTGRQAFELLRPGGRFARFGMASGEFTVIDENQRRARGVRLIEIPPPAPDILRTWTETALAEAAAGRLRPVVGQTFALDDAAKAHAAIEARATVGKTLLTT